ncbi:MAG TPA: hypothetical protein VHE35_29915 [Kofleriaceae bacterium]|nr:hypothetical protein [Kofleriaceae bacterium]
MRRAAARVAALALAIGAAAGAGACKPKVDPRSPFDEDDPRALREEDERARANAAAGGHGVEPPHGAGADAGAGSTASTASMASPADGPGAAGAAASSMPVAIPGAGVRGGMVARTELKPVLDAGPASFLGWFDTEAVLVDGQFTGWRLVKLLPAGQPLAKLDLVPGDVLVAVNGRPLSKPDELGDLWTELYAAGAIVAEIHRGTERFTLRFTIAGPPLPPPPGPVALPPTPASPDE